MDASTKPRPRAAYRRSTSMARFRRDKVARYARENSATREMPIIFVTAMHETEDAQLRGYGAGAVDFLFKPLNSYVLRSKVRVFLDLYRSRHRLAQEIEARQAALAEL